MKSPNEPMPLGQDEHFFLAEIIRHAKSLPFAECRQFLSGCITSLHGAHPARRRLSLVLEALDATDNQLELLQIGQLKFNLGEAS